MKRKNYLSLLILMIFIQVFCADCVFSQMFHDRSCKRPGMGSHSPILFGAVSRIDDDSIVVSTREGEQKKLTISGRTSFLRETDIKRNQLTKGDTLLIIGSDVEGDTIRPIRIIVQPTGRSSHEKRTRRAFGPPGGSGKHSEMQGPVIGTITELDPLTIKLMSGETRIVRTDHEVRLVKTTYTDPSSIAEGTKVRVIAPQKGSGSYNREAIKVIVLPEGGSFPRDGSGEAAHMKPVNTMRDPVPQDHQNDILSKTLLQDISTQPAPSDFIYGIWLGRGLFSNRELDRAFRVAKNLGIQYFKVEFKWSYVEPENNKWTWDNESTIDVNYLIQLSRRYNLSIIPYFSIGMPWGERRHLDPRSGECEGPPNRRGQVQAPDPDEYGEYVFTVVDRLVKNGVHVKYVELDNEISNLNDGYRSWNCFVNITAKEIKEAENIAYNRIKTTYPEIMISSTTFSFPGLPFRTGSVFKDAQRRKNSFIKAYFGEEPRPKFDFLAVHEVLSGSGSPYTTLHDKGDSGYEYTFGSYYDAYDTWRNILDRYGYNEKPIFNLESGAVAKGKQDIILLQRAIFARTQAEKNKVIGWVLSQLTGSKKFTEERGRAGVSVGITRLADGFELKEGYFGYYSLMDILSRYPNYEGKIAGETGMPFWSTSHDWPSSRLTTTPMSVPT